MIESHISSHFSFKYSLMAQAKGTQKIPNEKFYQTNIKNWKLPIQLLNYPHLTASKVVESVFQQKNSHLSSHLVIFPIYFMNEIIPGVK